MENFSTCQHFSSCKGQKHLDKNLYLQLQRQSVYSESNNYLSLPAPLHFPLALPSFCLCFLTFLSHKLERLMNCLESWLSSCCRVGPSFPLLSGMSSIQPEIMLAIGGICVNPVPVPVSQLELSFRDGFYADNYPNQSSPAWQPVHYIVSVSPL